MKSILALLCLLLTQPAQAACVGRMINPLSDVCWACLFPMTLGGFELGACDAANTEVNPQESAGPVCTCFPEVDKSGAPIPVGIPFSFWEPARLVEVTRTPGCLMVLNGTELKINPKMKGGPSTTDTGSKHSFYHVHWVIFPVLSLFEILTEKTAPGVELKPCVEQGEFDVHMTEFDPLWNDETLDIILHAEVFLFNNLIAQAACIGDCIKASITNTPIDALFWCGGCQGSLYPFTGTVSSHISGVQASLLLTQRLIAKRHRMGLEVDTSNPNTLCAPELRMRIKKTQYKTQMLYPKTRQSYQPLGRSDVLWAAGTETPHGGEDFSYLLWRKRACCLQSRVNWNPTEKVIS